MLPEVSKMYKVNYGDAFSLLIVQWNLDITVTLLGQYFLAVIHWVTCLCSDPVMY